MPQRIDLVALGVSSPALVGAWMLIERDDFDRAMLWLLIPAALAGIVLSRHFYPLRFSDDDSEAILASWRRTAIAIGWITLGYFVALALAGIAAQFIDPDLTAFLVAVFIAVIAGVVALIGVMAGWLVVLPLATLALAGLRLFRRSPGSAVDAAGPTMLLAIVAFAITVVFAVSVGGVHSARGRAWTAIFVLLTGLQVGDAHIISEPVAWLARGLLVIVVLTVVWFVRVSGRKRRAARQARVARASSSNSPNSRASAGDE